MFLSWKQRALAIDGMDSWRVSVRADDTNNYGKIRVNKSELVDALADGAGLSKNDASSAVAAMADLIVGELKKGGDVTLPGLGKFAVAHRKERQVRNPRTGETSTAPAHDAPVFKFSSTVKTALKG
jgi:DNA-binding protein HU-beta